MKERPILFSAPMVLAILAGRKRVTRRLDQRWYLAQPGDLLVVRETWATTPIYDGAPARAVPPDAKIFYLADGPKPTSVGRTRVSIHMPRWASRIIRPIVSVRTERLQDITDEDAKAEGLKILSKDGGRTWKWGIPDRDGWPGGCDIGWEWQDWQVDPRAAYARLWDLINPDRPWASNPALVRVEFAPLAHEASR